MTEASLTNRRQGKRAVISIAVRKKIGAKILLCQAADISTEGIFLANVLDEIHQNQARCLLEFSLPGSDTIIAARGRVVRQTINGRYHLTGIKFAAIAPSHRRLIQCYVNTSRLFIPRFPMFLPPATHN